MKNVIMIVSLVGWLLGFPLNAFPIHNLSENELGEITGQDGATFILQDFDFFIISPGIEYLATHVGPFDPPADPKPDNQRGTIALTDLLISDGNNGPVIMSTNLDWDIYSQNFGELEYNYARFSFYNTSVTMDLDVGDIAISPVDPNNPRNPNDPTDVLPTASLGGAHINGLSIDELTVYLGAASNNTGMAGEIDLRLQAESMTVDAFRHLGNDTPVILENIMVAGYFTGSEPDYDRSLPLPYTTIPGIWSPARAADYADGNAAYEQQLLAANRFVPDPSSWVPHGALKIGDVENGNPLRMDFTVDRNYYIPFPYDIVSGEPSQDSRVEWFEATSGDFFTDARGWRDGKDNYLQDGTHYNPIKNPRYNKSYISIDTPISGSLRIGAPGGDIVMVDGIDLQIHAEIPGYGYGNTPNSIPRPYPDPDLAPPQYDEPFQSQWQ
ncbi:MAG: hypothetical protein KKD44_22885 [Proteobacteria bacterium]|nr:hypothetical protein [Pseudomonadota bacterium]